MQNDDLLTPAQFGAALGLSARIVEHWLMSGLVKPAKLEDGKPLIAKSYLEELAQLSAKLSPSSEDASRNARRLRLLVIDDDPDFLDLFSCIATQWPSVEVTSASNGFEGLVLIGKFRPDVVVTDLSMPGIDGFEMLRLLTHPDSGYAHLTFIVVTALDHLEIQRRGGVPPRGACFVQTGIV